MILEAPSAKAADERREAACRRAYQYLGHGYDLRLH